MAVKPIPEGYHSVIPFLVCAGAAKVIDFMKQTFDAKEGHPPFLTPDGSVAHAEMKIGDSHVWLSDGGREFPAMPGMLTVYTEDVDAAYKRALEAGGTSLREPENQFYGDRSAGVKDPAGNQWWIHTRVENVSPEEMQKREEEFKKKLVKS